MPEQKPESTPYWALTDEEREALMARVERMRFKAVEHKRQLELAPGTAA